MEHAKPFLTETINKYLIKKSLREVRNFKNYYFTILINKTTQFGPIIGTILDSCIDKEVQHL
jgi:predicted RNA-binding protein associated with RNAse of E/G family